MKKFKLVLVCTAASASLFLLLQKTRSKQLNKDSEHQANDYYVPEPALHAEYDVHYGNQNG